MTKPTCDVSSPSVSLPAHQLCDDGLGGRQKLLSHLQELRRLQEQRHQILNSVHESQWQELKREGEKVNNLLEQQLNRPQKAQNGIAKTIETTRPMSQTVQQVNTMSLTSNIKSKKTGSFPFLKRGEGLKRYQSGNVQEKRKPSSNRSTVVQDISSESDKFPRRLIRKLNLKPSGASATKSESLDIEGDNGKTEGKGFFVSTSEVEETGHPPQTDNNDSVLEKRKEEMEELAEFEILEKVAHNCSFNSDSSVVNRLLQPKSTKNAQSSGFRNEETNIRENIERNSNSIAATNEEPFESRPSTSRHHDMPPLESDDDDWVDASSSDDDTSIPETESLGLRAFCNKMIGDLYRPRNVPLPEDMSSEEMRFDDELSWKDGSDTLEEITVTDSEGDFEPKTNAGNPNPEDSATQNAISSTELKGLVSNHERQLLQRRLKELEDEIAKFRKENELLSRLRKQHELLIQRAKSERELFAKEKEEYKQKLGQELLEEKKRLRKQQQNISKIQKRKETVPEPKEEKNFSKTEMQALEQEMKKQQRQWSAENGRLRMRLTSVEAECNRLKTECGKLEMQKKQLHAALKEKQPVKPHPSAFVSSHINSVPSKSSLKAAKASRPSKSLQKHAPIRARKETKVEIENENKNSEKEMESEKELDDRAEKTTSNGERTNNTGKPRVRFNLDSEVANEESSVVQEVQHSDKTERVFDNGDREIHYSSGSRKVISGDGRTSTVYFYNGDVKINLQDGTEVYYYAESGAKQTIHPDGLQVLEFPNGQEEKHYKDGTKSITSSNGTVRVIRGDGTEETTAPDGTVLVVRPDGSKVFQFVGGEREIHTEDCKRREYPDGTVKILHADGRLETRYASGRYRLKDGDGKVLIDTKYSTS